MDSVSIPYGRLTVTTSTPVSSSTLSAPAADHPPRRPIAGCYARKSNAEAGKEADAKSVAVQISEARRFAETRGWRFDDRYAYQDDHVSGAEFQRRPGLTALLEAIKAAKVPFDVLVVSEQSRLGRDTVRTLALIQSLEESGVQIWSYLDDARITLADDMDEVKEFIRSWSGSQERKKAGQRSRTAQRRMVESGRRPGGRLYGYTGDGEPVPDQVRAIRMIFERRAAGKGLYVIARELERLGHEPPRGKAWYTTMVQSVIRNTTYRGLLTWGRTRRVRRRGTSHFEPSPENVVTAPADKYRVVSDELWAQANAVSDASAERTWRWPDGRLKSRVTSSKWLLSPFLACGACGGSMHAKQFSKNRSGEGRYFYVCSAHHLAGRKACPNGRGLRVEWADKAILNEFDGALLGHVVLEALRQYLDEQRARAVDPKPLEAEAAKIKAEIKRLVDALAKGDLEDVHDAVRARKARLEHIEGTLRGIGVTASFDLAAFAERVTPVVADWRQHLRRNTSTAAQVLRKIVPDRLTCTPTEAGGWKIKGLTDYSKVLEECGVDAALALIETVANLSATRKRSM
jgi:site-specific DNA recombinase